jgi:hypothetical protein
MSHRFSRIGQHSRPRQQRFRVGRIAFQHRGKVSLGASFVPCPSGLDAALHERRDLPVRCCP